jgi:hypothetical protein
MEALSGLQFDDAESARDRVNETAKRLGFSLVIHKYKPNKLSAHTIILRCSKGRVSSSAADPSTHETKRRKTSTQKTGCPFRIALGLQLGPQGKGIWVIRRVDNDNALTHNHEFLDPSAFSRYRAYGIRKRENKITEMSKLGIRPQQILIALRSDDDPDVRMVSRTDLYNFLRKNDVRN